MKSPQGTYMYGLSTGVLQRDGYTMRDVDYGSRARWRKWLRDGLREPHRSPHGLQDEHIVSTANAIKKANLDDGKGVFQAPDDANGESPA
jgi:hypothetical protein